jgi:hypothetical protein
MLLLNLSKYFHVLRSFHAKKKKNSVGTAVVLVTWEVEIRRIVIGGQLG